MQRFERNADVCGDDAINAAIKAERTLITVADNVDHNICTLNGENTFHGMGMVAAIPNECFSSKVLSRRNVTNDEILKVSVVDIHDYKSLKSHESNKSLKRYLPCKRILNHLPTFFGKCHGIFHALFRAGPGLWKLYMTSKTFHIVENHQ